MCHSLQIIATNKRKYNISKYGISTLVSITLEPLRGPKITQNLMHSWYITQTSRPQQKQKMKKWQHLKSLFDYVPLFAP